MVYRLEIYRLEICRPAIHRSVAPASKYMLRDTGSEMPAPKCGCAMNRLERYRFSLPRPGLELQHTWKWQKPSTSMITRKQPVAALRNDT